MYDDPIRWIWHINDNQVENEFANHWNDDDDDNVDDAEHNKAMKTSQRVEKKAKMPQTYLFDDNARFYLTHTHTRARQFTRSHSHARTPYACAVLY